MNKVRMFDEEITYLLMYLLTQETSVVSYFNRNYDYMMRNR